MCILMYYSMLFCSINSAGVPFWGSNPDWCCVASCDGVIRKLQRKTTASAFWFQHAQKFHKTYVYPHPWCNVNTLFKLLLLTCHFLLFCMAYGTNKHHRTHTHKFCESCLGAVLPRGLTVRTVNSLLWGRSAPTWLCLIRVVRFALHLWSHWAASGPVGITDGIRGVEVWRSWKKPYSFPLLSPTVSAPGSSRKSLPGRGPSSTCTPILAGPSMVFGHGRPPRLSPVGDPRQEGPAHTGCMHDISPPAEDMEAVGLAPGRSAPKCRSLSWGCLEGCPRGNIMPWSGESLLYGAGDVCWTQLTAQWFQWNPHIKG